MTVDNDLFLHYKPQHSFIETRWTQNSVFISSYLKDFEPLEERWRALWVSTAFWLIFGTCDGGGGRGFSQWVLGVGERFNLPHHAEIVCGLFPFWKRLKQLNVSAWFPLSQAAHQDYCFVHFVCWAIFIFLLPPFSKRQECDECFVQVNQMFSWKCRFYAS